VHVEASRGGGRRRTLPDLPHRGKRGRVRRRRDGARRARERRLRAARLRNGDAPIL